MNKAMKKFIGWLITIVILVILFLAAGPLYIVNEGKESYNAEIPKAQGEADRQIQVAEGYAAERVNMAKGDVARFDAVYEEYKRSPKVTKERIYLETMDEIFGSENKPTLIDSELENLVPVKNLKD